MQGLIYCSQLEESQFLEYALKNAGMVVKTRRSLDQIIENWSNQPADLVLIALSADESKSPSLIAELRAIAVVPIVAILEMQPEDILVQYYQAGVDLILTRPLSLRLLAYQIRPLLIRSNSMPLGGLPDLIQPSFRLESASRTVIVGDQPPVHLTQLEFRLMYTLMIHHRQILSAEELVSLVWGYSGEENRELVRGLVQRLRSKVEPDPQNPRFIITEPGLGYRFVSISGD